MDKSAEHSLGICGEGAEGTQAREYVLGEANDRRAMACTRFVSGELMQRSTQLERLLNVPILIRIDRLNDRTTCEDERVILVVALAVTKNCCGGKCRSPMDLSSTG